MEKTEFCLPIRVYVEDTDVGGIVYYANYLKYIERARTEFMRSLGYDKPALFDGLMFEVHSLELKYLKPALLDDEVVATAEIIKAGGSSFLLRQEVRRGGDVLVTGTVKAACLDYETKRPVAIPASILTVLRSTINEK